VFASPTQYGGEVVVEFDAPMATKRWAKLLGTLLYRGRLHGRQRNRDGSHRWFLDIVGARAHQKAFPTRMAVQAELGEPTRSQRKPGVMLKTPFV